VQEWLKGVGHPELNTQLQQFSSAERLRMVFNLLTLPANHGGAGLSTNNTSDSSNTIGSGYIESIFAPHDLVFNKVCNHIFIN